MAKKLEDLTVPELKAKARKRRLRGYSNMNKTRLINLLRGKKSRSVRRSRKSRKKRSRKSRKSKRKSGKKRSRKSRKSKRKSRKSKRKSRKSKRKSRKSKKLNIKYVSNNKQTQTKMVWTTGKGCTIQTSAKYANRPSPPYPANECQGMIRLGNDGREYASTRNSNGVYTWKLYKD